MPCKVRIHKSFPTLLNIQASAHILFAQSGGCSLCALQRRVKMLKEFKEFAMRGSVLDMAIGIIIGAAFGKIVSSFVSDILMPPVGILLGKVNFSDLFINLSGKTVASVDEAKKLGLATVNVGLFLNTIIDFVIVAFVIFLMV